jgi:hypothetical protein
MNLVSHGITGMTFIFDLLTNIVRLGEVRNQGGDLLYFLYHYSRGDVSVNFEMLPLFEDYSKNIGILEYVFQQFSFFSSIETEDINSNMINSKKPNVVARGMEYTGTNVRSVLRSSGRYFGNTIRYFGTQYTSSSLKSYPNSEINPVDPISIQRAKDLRLKAEKVHAGARVVTSAILYPVRWTGKKAISCANSEPASSQPQGQIAKITAETIDALGNSVSSVFKGFTEFISEIGTAVGDCAMLHSSLVHGEEYANEVTQHYVAAFGEIGLAGYRLTNVVSIGLHGVFLDALVEGSSQFLGLRGYVTGPVLVFGYIEMISLPNVESEVLFAVLRPWALCLYKTSEGFIKKPYKIIPTCMLDTLPRARNHPSDLNNSNNNNNNNNNNVNSSDHHYEENLEQTKSDSSSNKPISLTRFTEDGIFEEKDDRSETERSRQSSQSNDGISNRPSTRIKRFMQKSLGEGRRHIEICTIDCSSYLLFPPEDTLDTWLRELKSVACNSNAPEDKLKASLMIATRRRLELLPKTNVISIQPKEMLIASSNEALIHLTGFNTPSAIELRANDSDSMIPNSESIHEDGHTELNSTRGLVASSGLNDISEGFHERHISNNQIEDEFNRFFYDYPNRDLSTNIDRENMPAIHTLSSQNDSNPSPIGIRQMSSLPSSLNEQTDQNIHPVIAESIDRDRLFSNDPDFIWAYVEGLGLNNTNVEQTIRDSKSMLLSARHSFGRLTDPIRYATILSARIEVVPITRNGYYFTINTDKRNVILL